MPALVLCPRLQQHICRYPYLSTLYLYMCTMITHWVRDISNVCWYPYPTTLQSFAHVYNDCSQWGWGISNMSIPLPTYPAPFSFTPLFFSLRLWSGPLLLHMCTFFVLWVARKNMQCWTRCASFFACLFASIFYWTSGRLLSSISQWLSQFGARKIDMQYFMSNVSWYPFPDLQLREAIT